MAKNLIEIGAVWARQTQDGEIYYSGNVNEKTRILILSNRFKKNPKAPDYRVFLAPDEVAEKKRIDRYAQGQAAKGPFQAEMEVLTQTKPHQGVTSAVFTEDDIPF